MEDGLVQDLIDVIDEYRDVLILVVVDDGLVHDSDFSRTQQLLS